MVATGIECSAPRIAGGARQDELRKTGHWERIDEDIALVADFEIRHLRYGYSAADPDAEPLAAFLNERRFVAWELAYGRTPSSIVRGWLGRHGMTDARLAWFQETGSDSGVHREARLLPSQRVASSRRRPYGAGSPPTGLRPAAREYHERLNLPFMLSGTNIEGPMTERWLAEVWDDALRLREEGLPIRGVCWYGFLDHVDWDTALTRDRGRVNHCGLVGLDRRPHPWGQTYRSLARAVAPGRHDRLGSATSRRYTREDAAPARTPEVAA